jgi:NCAIR mutase (PurE)-related protein
VGYLLKMRDVSPLRVDCRARPPILSIKSRFIGSGKPPTGAAQPTVKQQVTEKVKDVVEQKKQELKTQVTREVEKAEEKLHGEIQKKAPGLDAEVKKQEEQLKKNVSKLKKLF